MTRRTLHFRSDALTSFEAAGERALRVRARAPRQASRLLSLNKQRSVR